MGSNFKFNQWADEWLKKSGINAIEPIAEYDQDGSLKLLKVKQTVEPVGDNQLRTQVVDIAVYTNDF